jgi:hypothetical protein
LVERERDIGLHALCLLGELMSRHRLRRASRRIAPEEHDADSDGDHEQRHRDEHAGRRSEQATDADSTRLDARLASVARSSS